MVEQENSHGGTVRWKSGTVMVEQCGGTGEQSYWNNVVEKWNSVVEKWNSVVEQWNSRGGTVWWNSRTVEQANSHGGTVEQWNSRTVMVEQCGGQWNSHGGTLWWNSGTLMVEQCNETVEQ